jgi:hypothetical protein
MDHVGRDIGNIIGQHHSSRHGCDKDSCLRVNKIEWLKGSVLEP